MSDIVDGLSTSPDSENQLPPDKVCTACLELNLTEQVIGTFRTCVTCGELYCVHGASILDPQHCVYCCNDFKVVDIEESVLREVHNARGEVTSQKSYRVRHITLSGNHWLFHNRAISTMSDLELDHAIEYHRAILNGMLSEREARRVAHVNRNKGKVAGNEQRSLLEGTAANPLVQTGGGARATFSTTSSTVRRVKTVKVTSSGDSSTGQEKKTADITAALAQLLKAGLTKEQIAALGKK
ncbi:MAG TPA: hypothetical protein VGF75_00430 [Candidatus Saccharimonadales bacterium]|jgi:hypothetical protein